MQSIFQNTAAAYQKISQKFLFIWSGFMFLNQTCRRKLRCKHSYLACLRYQKINTSGDLVEVLVLLTHLRNTWIICYTGTVIFLFFLQIHFPRMSHRIELLIEEGNQEKPSQTFTGQGKVKKNGNITSCASSAQNYSSKHFLVYICKLLLTQNTHDCSTA